MLHFGAKIQKGSSSSCLLVPPDHMYPDDEMWQALVLGEMCSHTLPLETGEWFSNKERGGEGGSVLWYTSLPDSIRVVLAGNGPINQPSYARHILLYYPIA